VCLRASFVSFQLGPGTWLSLDPIHEQLKVLEPTMEDEKLIAYHEQLKASAPKGKAGGLGFMVKGMVGNRAAVCAPSSAHANPPPALARC